MNQGSYHYDGNGNRLESEENTTATELGYYSHSNQLYSINDIQIEHDAAGNQLNDKNGHQFHYNQAGRLAKVTNSTHAIAEYTYNAFNQRTQKQVGEQTTHFIYDLQGQLIQEVNLPNTTKPIPQKNASSVIHYIWLDSQAIAQITNNENHDDRSCASCARDVSASMHVTYITNDHLNTPRRGYNQDQQQTWRWASDGFGNAEPNDDPDGDGKTTTVNLRFPGQYADQETGLYYNWHRYYDPSTGRYVTSDPIGLMAGINTYGYVGGNPTGLTDLMGLYANVIKADNIVNIILPIHFYGAGDISETVSNFIQGIQEAWSGKFGKYTVVTKVVCIEENPLGNPSVNSIEVRTDNPFVTSHVNSDDRSGRWYKKSSDQNTRWTGAHEAGHLIGLEDYQKLPIKPYHGWEDSIMVAHGNKVLEQDILSILFRRGLIDEDEFRQIFQ